MFPQHPLKLRSKTVEVQCVCVCVCVCVFIFIFIAVGHYPAFWISFVVVVSVASLLCCTGTCSSHWFSLLWEFLSCWLPPACFCCWCCCTVPVPVLCLLFTLNFYCCVWELLPWRLPACLFVDVAVRMWPLKLFHVHWIAIVVWILVRVRSCWHYLTSSHRILSCHLPAYLLVGWWPHLCSNLLANRLAIRGEKCRRCITFS